MMTRIINAPTAIAPEKNRVISRPIEIMANQISMKTRFAQPWFTIKNIRIACSDFISNPRCKNEIFLIYVILFYSSQFFPSRYFGFASSL